MGEARRFPAGRWRTRLGRTVELINEPAPEPVPVVAVTSSAAPGYYAAGSELTLLVTFADLVTVEGTPALALSSGGVASYVSGSGTADLVFTYTVGQGENAQDLDYAATNALTGTITAGGSPVNFALPASGGPGSLAYGAALIIDTTPPTIAISAPSLTVTRTAEVSYQVAFADLNFGTASLTAEDVTLLKTGPADATVVVSGTAEPVQTVTLRNINGKGALISGPGAGSTSCENDQRPGRTADTGVARRYSCAPLSELTGIAAFGALGAQTDRTEMKAAAKPRASFSVALSIINQSSLCYSRERQRRLGR